MKPLAAVLLCAAAASAQSTLKWARNRNTFLVELAGQSMELELVSAATFRIRRGVPGPPKKPIADSTVDCKAADVEAGLRLQTAELVIEVTGENTLVRVSLPAGLRLFSETAARIAEGKALLEIESPATEKYYGFGPRPDAQLDARGLVVKPKPAFFVSSRGYAFWTGTAAGFTFDVARARPDRVQISGDGLERLEYYFAFGPSLKEIWDERLKVEAGPGSPTAAEYELLVHQRLPKGAMPIGGAQSAGSLCGDARALVHASLSGVLLPAFDLGRYRDAPDEMFRRASGLGVFAPVLYDSSAASYSGVKAAIVEETKQLRRRLSHFLVTYADEARSRGYPVLHPLMHQYPRDPEAGAQIDAFLFGDELLLAPSCEGATREVYLPQGIWTEWHSGRMHTGRKRIAVEAPESGVAVLARNGTIVPLAGLKPDDATELHYFPKLGAEFFLYEPEVYDYSQAHASPAADIYRLEMESKVTRRYEWVVHHSGRLAQVNLVGGGAMEEVPNGPLKPGQWRYDAGRRTAHIMIQATAHSDVIVNLEFSAGSRLP